jgi:hypothetical protein
MDILRDAFAKVANDPELKADATKMMLNIQIDPFNNFSDFLLDNNFYNLIKDYTYNYITL